MTLRITEADRIVNTCPWAPRKHTLITIPINASLYKVVKAVYVSLLIIQQLLTQYLASVTPEASSEGLSNQDVHCQKYLMCIDDRPCRKKHKCCSYFTANSDDYFMIFCCRGTPLPGSAQGAASTADGHVSEATACPPSVDIASQRVEPETHNLNLR